VIKTKVLQKDDVPYFDWPQVNTEAFIGSVARVLNSMELAVKSAFHDVIKRVEHMTPLDFMDAYMLLGQCVQIEICQMVGSANTVIAMVPAETIDQLNGTSKSS